MTINFVRKQRIDGETAGDRFGAYSIQVNGEVIVGATGEVADVNNDGFLDLIVGAGFGENGEDVGKVYVFFGDGTGFFDSTPILDAANADIIITGANSQDFFGASLALSDIDGDGQLDLLIGAPGTDYAAVDAGSVYLFLNQGAPTYFAATATGADLRIDGNQGQGEFGSYIASADFNNDGRPDLAVGTPSADIGPSPSAGAIYTFFNQGAPGFFPTSATGATQMISGAVADAGFGTNIIPADINGDGFTDLVVGSPLHTPATTLSAAGAVFIFLNNTSGMFPTSITTASQTIAGSQVGMQFGSCLSIADLGGDGDLDLIVGAPLFDPGNAQNQGALFIFFNNGMATAPLFPVNSAAADWRIDGENPGDFFGQSCHTADLDSANGPDLLVGAPRYNVGTVDNVGAAYIFLNEGAGGFSDTAAGADFKLTGEQAGDRFGSGIRTGDLTNDGLQDLLIGARLANFGGEDSGSIYVFLQQVQPPPPTGRRGVQRCEKLKVDRVICDEIFYLEDDEFGIPVGDIVVPPGSIINGTVTVTVMQCEPLVNFEADLISVDMVFMVQKELVITTPEEVLIPLEFGFRLARTVGFRKCAPVALEEIDPDLLEDLECRVVMIAGTDIVTLHPSTTAGSMDASFDEELTIMIKLKLIQERQLILQSGTARHQVSIDIAAGSTPIGP